MFLRGACCAYAVGTNFILYARGGVRKRRFKEKVKYPMNRQCITLYLLLWLAVGLGHAQAPADSTLWSLDLPEVVTTAQPEPTDKRAALHAVRVLDAQQLQKRGATNLEQALQQTIGIRLQQDLILGSSLTMMGMGGQNIQIMLDGVPIIGRQGGNIDLSQVNLDHVVRIELIEGPLGVAYGTNALAGVINIITRGSQLDDYRIGVNTQLESRGEQRLSAEAGFKVGNEWTIQLRGGRDRFAGWKTNPESRRFLWNPKDQLFAEANLLYQFSPDQRLRLQGRWFDEEVSMLGEKRRPQFKPYAFDQTFATTRNDVSLHYEGGVGREAYLKATAGLNQFRRVSDQYRVNFDESGIETLPDALRESRFDSWMARVQLAYPRRLETWQLQTGIDFRGDFGEGDRIAPDANSDTERATMTDLAGFVKFSYRPLDRLTLQAGGRYAWNSRYQAPLIPSAHVKWDVSDRWQWRASYGKGFRSPDLKELFFEFIDINHFILGNPQLQAETADHLQTTVQYHQKKNQSRLEVEAMLFYNHIRNRITLFEFVDGPGGPLPALDTTTLRFTYFNMDEFRSQGARLSGQWQQEQWSVRLAANATGLFNPEHALQAGIAPYSYQISTNASATYRFEQWLPWEVSVFAHYQDRLITYYPDVDDRGQTVYRQRQQAGFSQIDLSLNTRLWQDRLHITAGVRNALNVQQVNVQGGGGGGAHGGGANWAPISPGRSFFINTRLAMGWSAK